MLFCIAEQDVQQCQETIIRNVGVLSVKKTTPAHHS